MFQLKKAKNPLLKWNICLNFKFNINLFVYLQVKWALLRVITQMRCYRGYKINLSKSLGEQIYGFRPTHNIMWKYTCATTRQNKTCLREFPTRPDTNRPAQPQKVTRVLKFRLQNLEIVYYLSNENKGADQTARMRRLICDFIVRIWHKIHFLMAWLTFKVIHKPRSSTELLMVQLSKRLTVNDALRKSTTWTKKKKSILVYVLKCGWYPYREQLQREKTTLKIAFLKCRWWAFPFLSCLGSVDCLHIANHKNVVISNTPSKWSVNI